MITILTVLSIKKRNHREVVQLNGYLVSGSVRVKECSEYEGQFSPNFS